MKWDRTKPANGDYYLRPLRQPNFSVSGEKSTVTTKKKENNNQMFCSVYSSKHTVVDI